MSRQQRFTMANFSDAHRKAVSPRPEGPGELVNPREGGNVASLD
ncbi:hypothetical protein WA016_02084 [Myxococcus stipitatus]